MGVPANGQGEQTAFNGGSYAGFIAYRDEPVLRGLPEGIGGPLTTYESGYLEYSEYLTTELTAPLIAGKAYRITYQVSLSDKSELAVNHLGAYVSVESPDQVSNKFMDVSPSFKTSLVSSDKEGWTSISGTFTASGGEKFLTIGVFDWKKMKVLDVVEEQWPKLRQAYYYVDGMNIMPAEGVDFNLILNGANVVLTKLLFDLGKATIKPESYEQLDRFSEWLLRHETIGVSVDGHTDKSGSDEFNLTLSKQRADAVKTYLVDKGVDGSKLFTRGFGDTQPVDTSRLENNPKNRRVELSLRK